MRGSMRNIGSSFSLRGFKLETLSKLSSSASVVSPFGLASAFDNFEADLRLLSLLLPSCLRLGHTSQFPLQLSQPQKPCLLEEL